MNDVNKLTPGDILLVRDGRSVIAKGITLFMREYCELNGYEYDKIYHHAAIVIEDRGVQKIAEAVGRGWKVQRITKAYSQEDYRNRVDVFQPCVKWAPEEIVKLSGLALEYSEKITRYDYANFVFQMIMIQTGRWIGPTGEKAEGRLYCSEGVATILHKTRSVFCPEPWRYNPMDLYLEPGLIRIDK